MTTLWTLFSIGMFAAGWTLGCAYTELFANRPDEEHQK